MKYKTRCPWCKGTLIAIKTTKHKVCGICMLCDAEGPAATTEEEAIKLWNDRKEIKGMSTKQLAKALKNGATMYLG